MKDTNTRIYVVLEQGTPEAGERLVEAASAAQAIRYCAKHVYTARAAGPKDIANLMGKGAKIEQATEATQTN